MKLDKFTQKSTEAIELTQKLADKYGQQELQTEHLLYALLTLEDSLVAKILMKQGIALDSLVREAENLLAGLPRVSGSSQDPYVGTALRKSLENAEDEARKMGDQYISVEHLFLGLIRNGSAGVKNLLKKYGVKESEFIM